MFGIGLLKGLAVTFGQIPKKKVTFRYPDAKYEMPERFRGIQEYIPDLCIVCYQCARICPTSCISLTGTRGEDKKLHIDSYDIDFETCILCGLCAEVCPTEAVRMTNRFELAEYSRDALYKDMHWLYDNHKTHGSYEKMQAEKEKAMAEAKAASQAATGDKGDGA